MITKFLASYGFSSFKDFLLSLFPSFKYGIQSWTLTFSAVMAVISELLGCSPVIVLVMFFSVIVETVTGIRASRKLGQPFESFKFSRCVLKVFIWVFLLYMFHSFAMDMHDKADNWIYLIGEFVFDVLHVTTMFYFVIEYSTSILENLAVLDGKPKEALVMAVSDVFTSVVDRFKSLLKK